MKAPHPNPSPRKAAQGRGEGLCLRRFATISCWPSCRPNGRDDGRHEMPKKRCKSWVFTVKLTMSAMLAKHFFQGTRVGRQTGGDEPLGSTDSGTDLFGLYHHEGHEGHEGIRGRNASRVERSANFIFVLFVHFVVFFPGL